MSAPKMHPRGACARCDAIWREYANATAEHLKLQLDLYMAGTAHELAEESRLNELLAGAQSRRDEARDVVRGQEAQEHEIVKPE
jgi:hypothetical protein